MKLYPIMVVGTALQTTILAVAALQTTNLTGTHDTITQSQQKKLDGSYDSYLWTRKGGHGSSGRGGGKSSSKPDSSSGSNRGAASSSSSTGGRTTTGSGIAPAYGNGRFYGGGTTVPYRAGSQSTGGIAPFTLGDGLAAIAFWPGAWNHLPYLYPHEQPWYYHNQTSGRDEIKPVLCGCGRYQECGCDDNADQAYIDSIIGNGNYGSLNRSLVSIGDVNGTETILINGTLPNGTTASGGRKSPNAAAGLMYMTKGSGWWPAFAIAAVITFFV